MPVKQLKIYIDENIAPQCAWAMNIIQEHLNLEEKKAIKVLSLLDVFDKGIQDEDWIPKLGQEQGVIITQDRNIQFSKHQRKLYIHHGVGILFLKSPKNGMTFWQMFKHLVTWWDDIKQIVRHNNPPFAFRQPGMNHKFIEWIEND